MRRAFILAAWLAPLLMACGSEPPARVERSTEASRPDTELVARGNEPFWAVTVTRAGIVFSEPEHPEGITAPYAPPTVDGSRTVYRSVLRGDPALAIELSVEPRPCSDGMSDKAYAYAAVVRLGPRTLHGCAERPARSPTGR